MGRTIKTRHVQKDIKVLDKTVTAAEHMKGAYIRTRDSAEQTQIKEQGNPDEVTFGEDNGLTLASLKGETDLTNEKWTDLIDQITLEEAMIRTGLVEPVQNQLYRSCLRRQYRMTDRTDLILIHWDSTQIQIQIPQIRMSSIRMTRI